MAFVRQDELGAGRRVSKDFTETRLTRRFHVERDNAGDGPLLALESPGIPRIGDPHPQKPDAIAIDQNADAIDSTRLLFLVTVEYATVTITFAENPLDDEPVINWRGREVVEAVTKDIDGVPIENSAFDAFIPPINERRFDDEVTIQRNERNYRPDFVARFRGRVNDAPIRIAGKQVETGQGRLTEFSGASGNRNGIDFFSVTYKIEFKTDEIVAQLDNEPTFWRREILDQGFNELIGGTGTGLLKREILDNEQRPVKKEQKLNGAGLVLPSGEDPVYLLFETVESADFSELRLPRIL